MNDRLFLYVANWKMRFSHDEALSFCQSNKTGLERLAQISEDKVVVLCPSFDVLSEIAQSFKHSRVMLGAQNCSPHLLGNYTGEVAVESLTQLGCSFCIIGHSERRAMCGETDTDVALKIERLLQIGITPIVCVGETKEQHDGRETLQVVTRQVKAALKGVKKAGHHTYLCIAYEPVWAIGTGAVASNDHIEGVFKHIKTIIAEHELRCDVPLLYGGSVDGNNVIELKKIQNLGGFLVGGASLDFQKFEKIVT